LTSHDLDRIFDAARRPRPIAPRLLERIRTPILSSLTPVRPLPRSGVFVAAFLILTGAIAAGAAALAGVGGLPLLKPIQRLTIFGVLASVAALTAFTTARNMRPGLRSLPGWAILPAAFIAIEGVFALLFHDRRLTGFVATGVPCLQAGVVCAIPAGVLIWLLVRRGFVVAPVSTGAAAGALAGCAGLGMLELHCSILMFPHIAVWHAGVLLLGVAAGALIGRLGRV
jgi:hypothetical protein